MSQRREQVVDEFGALYLQIGPLKKRHEQLREEILGWVAKEAADAEVAFAGKTHVVTVSARASERLVLVKKLYKLIGLKRLLEICQVTLKKVENLPPEEREQVVELRKHEGPRQVTATPRFVAGSG